MVAQLIVRERVDADLDICIEMARSTHAVDGYPVYLPDDLRPFVDSPDAFATWVAERSGTILGHVALHRRRVGPVVDLAAEVLGQPVDRLGVVARLFVSPTARRSGIGRVLLEVAANEAVARGLWPILDVGTGLRAAIALYEHCGWTRIGEVTVHLEDDLAVDEFVYRGPVVPTGAA